MFPTFSKASATVLPPLHGGWTTRRKTEHFSAYNQVAAEFAKLIDIDEWQINPYFEKIGGLDFQEREGEDALAEAVERVLAKFKPNTTNWALPTSLS